MMARESVARSWGATCFDRTWLAGLVALLGSACSSTQPAVQSTAIEVRPAFERETPRPGKQLRSPSGIQLYVLDEVLLTDRDATSAKFVSIKPGVPALQMTLSAVASDRYFSHTSTNVGQYLAVFFDGELANALHVLTPVKGSIVVWRVGNQDGHEELSRIADAINSRWQDAR